MKLLRYMIRNGEGQYSLGGYGPVKFTDMNRAKIWRTIGAVSNHLNLVMEHEKAIPDDWVIVPIVISEDEATWSAKSYYEHRYLERKEKERVESEQRRKERLLEQKKQIDEELKNL